MGWRLRAYSYICSRHAFPNWSNRTSLTGIGYGAFQERSIVWGNLEGYGPCPVGAHSPRILHLLGRVRGKSSETTHSQKVKPHQPTTTLVRSALLSMRSSSTPRTPHRTRSTPSGAAPARDGGLRKPETGPHSRHRGLPANRRDGGRRAQVVPVSHPSRIATDQWKPDSSSPEPALRSPDCHPNPLIFASGNGTAAIWMCCGRRGLLASVTGATRLVASAASPSPPQTLAMRLKAPDPFNVRRNGRLLQCPHAAMEAARPGLRRRSTDVFVGGSRPARIAPPIKPSAQPFSPRPRSTDGVHIDQSGTNLEPTWTCLRSSLLKPGIDDQGNYRRDRGRYPGKNLSRTGASSFRPCVRRPAHASMATAKPETECPPLLGDFPTDSALFYIITGKVCRTISHRTVRWSYLIGTSVNEARLQNAGGSIRLKRPGASGHPERHGPPS